MKEPDYNQLLKEHTQRAINWDQYQQILQGKTLEELGIATRHIQDISEITQEDLEELSELIEMTIEELLKLPEDELMRLLRLHYIIN